ARSAVGASAGKILGVRRLCNRSGRRIIAQPSREARSMSEPFLSSDDYDERAHQLYNEAQYDEAIETLREGLGLYPHAVELHVGMGYARLAREEYVWARRAFEEAVGLDPEHEDALAGLGEVLLKFGDRAGAIACFDRILALGFRDDHDLMRRPGRASISQPCCTIRASTRRRCCTSSAARRPITSTASRSGVSSSSRRAFTACPMTIPSSSRGITAWTSWPRTPVRKTCCSRR